MAPNRHRPDNPESQTEAAASGAAFHVWPRFGASALQLLDNGYAPLPIVPGQKRPALARWSNVEIDQATVEAWAARYPDHAVGLRTGALVAIDIDSLEADLSHRLAALAQQQCGQTLLRVGLWPKRLLLYRTEHPFPKRKLGPVEILGLGQQVVAFGIHPKTGRPYSWPLGETPLEVPLGDLPEIDEAAVDRFLGTVAALIPAQHQTGSRARAPGPKALSSGAIRDETGQVTDGRDAWLSTIAYHVVQDAIDARQPLDVRALADLVWARFQATTRLDRTRKDGGRAYGPGDASRKVRDKLRLHHEGRLPTRALPDMPPVDVAPETPVDRARQTLTEALAAACARFLDWHDPEVTAPRPQIGIKATVGLGKSSIAREHLVKLRTALAAKQAPNRITVFTPSHRLAEETADAWRQTGAEVAVLRGYERRQPGTGTPMCQDLEAVRAAVAARLDPQTAICAAEGGQRCRHFHTCAKQQNRREVRAADVIVAPYDALFSGFALDPASIGLLVIDEGCWARAIKEIGTLTIEGLRAETRDGYATGAFRGLAVAQLADLVTFRRRLLAALERTGIGPVGRTPLLDAGLTAELCRLAAGLERKRRTPPRLVPGLTGAARARALAEAHRNEGIHRCIGLWQALAHLLDGQAETDGRIAVCAPTPANDAHRIFVTDLHRVHENFRGLPVLHLDATLRPDLARAILPDLEVTEITAEAPHMSVHLVQGRFGKSAIVPDAACPAEERQRRARNLTACVDHVRWQARRLAPGRLLVVTYKGCEAAFAGIAGVDTAHFNAIAGLDAFGDVAGLIVIGRPLPRDTQLAPLAGAFFGHRPEGGYRPILRGIHLRDGRSQAVRVLGHEDDHAELLRAAICDDEVIQAIGRGRGVNRTAANPLEVHVLADVALPLAHDSVLAWESAAPDLLQRMLLAGVAVDAPADAAELHPDLLGTAKTAQKAFERMGVSGVFKRQTPYNIYRGMSLKSAAYRRGGRGRSWQRALWLADDPAQVRDRLEQALGPLAGWMPDGSLCSDR